MSSRYDFQVSGGGGGGGAPANATYLTLSLDGTLTNERVFAPGATLGAVDGGAGGLYTLNLATVAGVAGSYTYAAITVDGYGRITAAANGAAPVASGWTDGGTTVYLTTATDVASVGSNVGVTNRKLSIYNTGTNLGASVVALASTDTVIETFVTGEANLRWAVDGSGSTRWGAGGGSALDTRIFRSGASTLTVDNAAGGSAILIVKGTTATQQRLHNITSKTFADSGYTVSTTDDTIFWNASGGNSVLNLVTPVGAGGREIVIKRTDTSANTLTVTPAAGQIEGAASLVIAGGASRASFTLRSDNANWWIV